MRTETGAVGTARQQGGRWPNRRGVLGGGLGAVGVWAAGPPVGALAQGVAVDELRYIAGEAPYGLDPVHEFSGGYLRSAGAYEGLLRATPAGDLVPHLAQSFELVDPLTWQVTLRPHATFWSGRPVDSGAVIQSLERARALNPPAANLLRGVRLEAPDEWTVHFKSDAPQPGLPYSLTDNWLVIHNAESFGLQDNSYDVGAVDATGPFRVVEYEPRALVRLVAHGGYWGPRPRTQRITYREVGDPDARALATLSGEVHLVAGISAAAVRTVERSRSMRALGTIPPGTQNTYLNTSRPPFDDVRVRQALSWALDRDELVQLAFDGRALAVSSMLASNPMYPEARRVGFTRHDPARAAQLLDEAGWRLPPGGGVRMKDGAPLRFRVLWWSTLRPIAEVLQGQWAEVGAQVEVDGSTDYAYTQQKRAQNDWEAHIEFFTTYGDPTLRLARLLTSNGDNNLGKLQDRAMDALFTALEGMLDAEERRQQALKINQRQSETVSFIPMAAGEAFVAADRRLRNYEPHPLGGIGQSIFGHPDIWVEA